MIYVGRMLPGGKVAGMEGVHRAPRREPGSGVLIGLDKSSGELSGIAADLKQLADAHKIPLAADYSADITPAGYLPPPAFPARWTHIGIATAWPDTPAEAIGLDDLIELTDLMEHYLDAAQTARYLDGLSAEHFHYTEIVSLPGVGNLPRPAKNIAAHGGLIAAGACRNLRRERS